MRALFWVLGMFGVAVGLVLAARYNSGYVLLLVHPWRVELSLNLLVIGLAGAFVVGYGFVRVAVHTLRMPQEVRAWRERRREERGQRALLDAVRAQLEGRYGRVEKLAAEALSLGCEPGLSAVLAARAAHELGATARRDAHLAEARRQAPSQVALRVLAEAVFLLDERRENEALARLDELGDRHTAALRLELRAQQMAKHWDRIPPLVAKLRDRNVFDDVQARELVRVAIIERLNREAWDAQALRACWDRLAPAERRDRRIAAACARHFATLGDPRTAHAIIETSLDAEWDSELAGLYGEALGEDAVKQVERAEAWLASHPQDAALLLTLGRLCAHLELWGKARSYLEASLAIEPGYTGHLALAELLERLGDRDGAMRHFRESLRLAIAQLRAASGGRRRIAT